MRALQLLLLYCVWVLALCTHHHDRRCRRTASGSAEAAAGNYIWHLNHTFAIDHNTSATFFLDQYYTAAYRPLDVDDVSADYYSSNSTVIFPCLLELGYTPAATDIIRYSNSTMFALCMRSTHDFRPVFLWVTRNGARGNNVSLTLQTDDDLILRGDQGHVAWTSNTSGKGVTRMELNTQQLPANLILFDSHNRTVWQSIDYPGNTLSIGQYLNMGMKLVSWASSYDASEGKYSLVMSPSLQQYRPLTLFYKSNPSADSIPYWQFDDYSHSLFTKAYVTSQGFFMAHTDIDRDDAAILYTYENLTSFVRLDPDGSLKLLSLHDSVNTLGDLFDGDAGACKLPLSCGSYGVCFQNRQCKCPDIVSTFVAIDPDDPTKGCHLAWPFPTCNNSDRDSNSSVAPSSRVQMQLLEGVAYFSDVPNAVPPLNVSNEDACSQSCLNNCSCLVAFWYADSNVCLLISQQQMGSFRGGLNKTIYKAFFKVSTTPAESPLSLALPGPNHRINVKKLAGAICGIGIGALLLMSFSLFFMHRKGYIFSNKAISMADKYLNLWGDTTFLELPQRFSYKELYAATNGFSHKLGQGGFGAVYAGILANGTMRVAVKKLEGMKQGEKEFKRELAIMGGIHHYNLLHLMGYCAEGVDRRLLVYKYMENGSLDQWLFTSSSPVPFARSNSPCEEGAEEQEARRLKWGMRYEIAVGVAKGLAYLHEECRKRIIHLDIKPQNILLDESFVAKVADFGLSRGMERDESHVVTTMRGTPGYLAPEWFKEGTIDVNCDVFSFGMLLMEIVSGRKNTDPRCTAVPFYPEWAFSQLVKNQQLGTTEPSTGHMDGFSDAKLDNDEERAQLRRLITTAFFCVLERPEWRPKMSTVVQMLEGLVDISHIDLSSLHEGLTFVLGSHEAYNVSALERHNKFQQQLLSILADLHTSVAAFSSNVSSGHSQLSGR